MQQKPTSKYVSRGGDKLASVADRFGLDFSGATVLDIGSSTGGFTDFALSRGAAKVVAVDVGSHQLHPSLRLDQRVEIHEKTDIRQVFAQKSPKTNRGGRVWIDSPGIILIDVSFISIREILGHVAKYLATPDTRIVAMVKPQFEAAAQQKHAGVIKNNTQRRLVLRDFETWVKKLFRIEQKADSVIAGASGNVERFYLLGLLKRNSTTSSGRIM